MKYLYLAEDNCYNYILVRDLEKDDECDTLVVNWDLTEEEIKEITKKFEADENDESFYIDNDQPWESFQRATESMCGVQCIA